MHGPPWFSPLLFLISVSLDVGIDNSLYSEKNLFNELFNNVSFCYPSHAVEPDLSLTRRRPTRLALGFRYLHYIYSVDYVIGNVHNSRKAFISSILSLNSFLNMLSFNTYSILRTCSENIQK